MLPSFPIPEEIQAKGILNDSDYLAFLVEKGAKGIYGDVLSDEVSDRLDFELSVINDSGYSRYFLIMQDIVNHARNELGAVVGPGRGSAAGSLVAYCLGITKIDPLKHDLLFERFMCPGRKAVPDIDVDFDDKGRQRVVEWLKEKYGKNNSAHIITFSKMLPERTFKEIAQLEKIPEGMTEKLYNAIPNEWRHLALKTAIQFSPDVPQQQKNLLYPITQRRDLCSHHLRPHYHRNQLSHSENDQTLPSFTQPAGAFGSCCLKNGENKNQS